MKFKPLIKKISLISVCFAIICCFDKEVLVALGIIAGFWVLIPAAFIAMIVIPAKIEEKCNGRMPGIYFGRNIG